MSEETDEQWLDRILYGDAEHIDLCDELEQSKVQIDGKTMLRHRYIETQEYEAKHNAWYNERFETNRKRAEELKAKKKWWE